MSISTKNTQGSKVSVFSLVVQQRNYLLKCQRGSSFIEFLLVTPCLLFLGMGTMQIGLFYHAKSILNYATFEAARTGAVNNAQIDVMRKELAYRMAPIFGGSGSLDEGVNAIERSKVIAQDPTATKIQILNPTPRSFALHGEPKSVIDSHGNQRAVIAIPNSHLRFRDSTVIKEDGLNIQDANLLKIRVTYGYLMRVPFLDTELPGVKWILRSLLLKNDPDNWKYYIRGMIPLTSTATVRMHSEAWDSQLESDSTKMFDSYDRWTKEVNDEVGISNENEDQEKTPPECYPDTELVL